MKKVAFYPVKEKIDRPSQFVARWFFKDQEGNEVCGVFQTGTKNRTHNKNKYYVVFYVGIHNAALYLNSLDEALEYSIKILEKNNTKIMPEHYKTLL